MNGSKIVETKREPIKNGPFEMWDIRLDMRNKAGFTIAIAFGREMATNRKMGGVEGERGREGEGYRTMTILRALAWSQPTQGNTCSRLAGYDRCHWLAKLPPGLHTLGLRRLYSLSLSFSRETRGIRVIDPFGFLRSALFRFDPPPPSFLYFRNRENFMEDKN